MKKINSLLGLEHPAIPNATSKINTDSGGGFTHAKGIGLKCLTFVCFLITALFVVNNLQAQQLFSIGETQLSPIQQNTLAELTKNRVIPASLQTVPFDISLQQITTDSALILKNEQNGATVVLSGFAQGVDKVTITPILVAELKNSVLGEGADFTCNLVSKLENDSLNLVDTIDFTLSETVELPTFKYVDEGIVKQSTTTDRKLTSVFVVCPRFIPINNDPETLKIVQEEAKKYAAYAYQYKLPNGRFVSWMEKDPFFSSSKPEIEAAAVKKVTVRKNGGLPFEITTFGLTSEQQACVEASLKYLSGKVSGNVPVRCFIGFEYFKYIDGLDSDALGSTGILPSKYVDGYGYAPSLLNNLEGSQVYYTTDDEDGNLYDFYALFNSSYEYTFHYETSETARSCPSNKYDFFSVIAHEALHGLGFWPGIDQTGSYDYGYPMIYDKFLSYNGKKLLDESQSFRASAVVSENLVWTGNNVKNKLGRQAKLYAPSKYEIGSSVSHWDYNESFTTLMRYAIDSGEVNYFGDLDGALLLDIGWPKSSTKTVSSITIIGDDSVNVGSTITLTCKATYSDGTSETVKPTLWNISQGVSYATTMVNSSGVLTLTGNAAGTVIVKASYSGKTTTKSVTVVNPNSVITILTQPQDVTAKVGDKATLSVEFSCSVPVFVAWSKDNKIIGDTYEKLAAGRYVRTHTFNSIKASDAGEYYFYIQSGSYDGVYAASRTATVTVVNSSVSNSVITILTQPQDVTAKVGDKATLSVEFSCSGPVSVAWFKDKERIGSYEKLPAGRHLNTYTFNPIKASDAGEYYLFILSDPYNPYADGGYATSRTATVRVNNPVSSNVVVNRSFSPSEYTPGKTVDVTLTVSGTETLSSLSLTEVLPSGWAFNSMVKDGGMDVKPDSGATGKMDFMWFMSKTPSLPFSVTYRVNVPSGASGDYSWSGTFDWAGSQGMPIENITIGGENKISKMVVRYHSGDYNNNWMFDQAEMVRISQLYKAKGYHVDLTQTDGFAPGSGATSGSNHSGDYNNNWMFDQAEMVRISQLYKAKGYHVDLTQTDGFAPGAASSLVAAGESDALVSGNRIIIQNGETADIRITIDGEGDLTSLAISEILPEGWSFNSVIESCGMDVKPEMGESGKIDFLWFLSKVPEMPFTVIYRVNIPQGEQGTYPWSGTLSWAHSQGMPEEGVIGGENSVTVKSSGEEAPELEFFLEGRNLVLIFTGTLESSEDGINWTTVEGAISPYCVDATKKVKFYRTVQIK